MKDLKDGKQWQLDAINVIHIKQFKGAIWCYSNKKGFIRKIKHILCPNGSI